MAINFPDSPTNGQVVTVGGKNYTYNSTKNTWTPTQVTEADLSSIGSTTVVATHDLLPASPSAGDMALVSSVNKMYVYFLSGWWLMSSLQNASPSGITGNAAIYDLAADGTPTTVTLSSSDPEGFPISWSHSIISGSLGGTTVTNVNNVFTITPSTDAADAGTFTLRFAASDGQGGESGSQSQFTLDFVFIITNSRYTTLLATATGTSDNNNITDSSTNNHTITVGGNAHAGTFSPYRNGGYSTNMDGGDLYYLSSSADWNLGSSWTIEGWFYPTAQPTEACRLFMFGTNGGSAAMGIGLNSDMTWGGGGAFPNGAMFNLPQGYLNQWQHVAWVRDGNSNTGTIYVNGVASAGSYSGPAVQAAGNVDLKIGYDTVGTVAYQYRGYFADIRITKSAVYTTNFTPPTERLTSSDVLTDTKLLAFNKPYLEDQSTSNHNISISAGDPKIKPFSPYDYNEYSATNNGGSVYFDGSGDSLNTTATQIIPSTSFTVTAWVYFKDTTQNAVWGQGTSGHSGRCGVSLDNGTWYAQIGNAVIGQSTSPSINEWLFTDLQWDGSTLKFFVNGSLIGSASTSNSPTNSALYIGDLGSSWTTTYPLNGYVSDLKVVSGTPSGSSTVPTAPLSSSGSVLHLKGTDASIVDKAQSSNLKLLGNTTGSTTQVKFADTKSMYFDAAGDYITIPYDEAYGFGTGDWTIETWLYCTKTGGFNAIFDTRVGTGTQTGSFGIGMYNTGRVQLFSGGIFYYPTDTLSFNTWQHFAVVKNSGTTTMYFNGTAASSTYSDSRDYGSSQPVQIGKDDTVSNYFGGYMQDFRITKGLARYTANFTPPTASLEG